MRGFEKPLIPLNGCKGTNKSGKNKIISLLFSFSGKIEELFLFLFQLLFPLLAKFWRNVIIQTAAYFFRKEQSTRNNAVPLFFRQSVGYVTSTDIVLDDSKEKTSIKVVARTNSTDRLYGSYGILLAEPAVGSQFDRFSALRINELLGIE